MSGNHKNKNRSGFIRTPTLALLLSVFNRIKKIYQNLKKIFFSLFLIQRNKNTMPKLVCGFTLIEMMVSIAIISIITSVVLFNYSTFSDNLALSSAAQELAITIRQAQTYGLTVKEVTPRGGVFDKAYGVYFNKAEPSNYYLFTDSNGDHYYDGVLDVIEKTTMRNGITIFDIGNETSTPPPSASTMMHITFLRPNPDAKIYFTNPSAGPFLTGIVVLRSPKGKKLNVTIESTGQVLVGSIYE